MEIHRGVQPVEKRGAGLSQHHVSVLEMEEKGKNVREVRRIPPPICQLFQIHAREFQRDPLCYPSQASVSCITHSMLFLRIGKDALYALLAQSIKAFAISGLP